MGFQIYNTFATLVWPIMCSNSLYLISFKLWIHYCAWASDRCIKCIGISRNVMIGKWNSWNHNMTSIYYSENMLMWNSENRSRSLLVNFCKFCLNLKNRVIHSKVDANVIKCVQFGYQNQNISSELFRLKYQLFFASGSYWMEFYLFRRM